MRHSTRLTVLIVWTVCSALFAINALAETPLRLDQYRHRAWRASDGWFEGSPTSIAQGPDGYLWIGTENGVYRFDGVKFDPFLPQGRGAFGFTFGFMATADGSMWIASESGLSLWKNNNLTEVMQNEGSVTSVYQDRAGAIWATTSGGKKGSGTIFRIDSENVPHGFGEAEGIATQYAQQIVEDRDGNYWIAAGAVTKWRPGTQGTEYFTKELSAYGTGWGVQSLLFDTDGSVLAGLTVTSEAAGLQRFKNGQWSSYKTDGFTEAVHSAVRMLRDRSGALWLSPVDSGGVVRVSDGRSEHFSEANGLTDPNVSAIAQDREGTVWVATTKGLDSFIRPAILTFPLTDKDAPPPNLVTTDGNNTIWIGTPRITTLKDGRDQAVPQFANLPLNHRVNSMLKDSQGRIWAGIYNTLYLLQGEKLSAVPDTNGARELVGTELVTSLVEDTNHVIWANIAGRNHERLVQVSPTGIKDITTDDKTSMRWLVADGHGGIWQSGLDLQLFYIKDAVTNAYVIPHANSALKVREMILAPDDTLLLSTSEGLVTFKEKVWHQIGVVNGLPCASIDSTVLSDDGAAWMSTRCGLIRLPKTEWSAADLNSQTQVHPLVLGPLSGWTPTISITGQKSVRALDGRLWFSNLLGLQMIDPKNLGLNGVTPPLAIEHMFVDHRPVPIDQPAVISPRPTEVQFDYTALSLVEPRQMQFRYRLEGHDTDWQDPGLRRQAFYNDLGPGDYRFEFKASNNDGLWSAESASVGFKVLPTFYQTNLFKVLCALAVIFTVWIIYSLRIRQVTRLIELTHRERSLERESIARDLHDTFFQTVQSLFLRLHTAMKQLPANDSATRDTVEAILSDSDRAMADGRKTFLEHSIEEADDVDLDNMLMQIGREFESAYQIAFLVNQEGDTKLLKSGIKHAVYKLAREAIYNAFQHSNASVIEVTLDYAAENFSLKVKDDGTGFDPDHLPVAKSRSHWGIKNMALRAHELGAILETESQLGQGTVVTLLLPASLAYRD